METVITVTLEDGTEFEIQCAEYDAEKITALLPVNAQWSIYSED